MSDETQGSGPGSPSLPDAPSLEWLRKQAKRLLAELRRTNPQTRLAAAQFEIAKRYGFPSWRALKAHVDSLTLDGQLIDAARTGDTVALATLLDGNPEKLHVRSRPYEWTLLHHAARHGRMAAVELLLERGLDVNVREKGDNTYAMHWAAAAGHVEVVRRLAAAGGDVVGRGDDHELEVIGWATCWEGSDDDAHRAVAEILVAHGARHHIFSAIALDLDDEVRRIVAADPSELSRTMSRNEDHQRPLHFAVRVRRARMVELLIELGADPLATDGSGYPPSVYAATPDIDGPVLEAIRARGRTDLLTALALGDWHAASRLLREDPQCLERDGALHLMARRGNLAAVRWLLDQGADPNARWSHWDAEVTPLHLGASRGHEAVVRLLLDAGADPTIRDSKHDGDPIGWAEHFGRPEIVRLLRARDARP